MAAIETLNATEMLTYWGAGISTLLAVIKIWEVFWRDRLKIDHSYWFTGLESEADTITLYNLSPFPIQVMSWSLELRPKLFRYWLRSQELSPNYDIVSGFKIDGHSVKELEFGEEFKINFGSKVSKNYDLILNLKIAGRTNPKRIVIAR